MDQERALLASPASERLLTLYAQTLREALSLRLSQIKQAEDALFIQFSETWLPLDDMTARRVEELARWNELTLPRSEHFDGIEYPRLSPRRPKQFITA